MTLIKIPTFEFAVWLLCFCREDPEFYRFMHSWALAPTPSVLYTFYYHVLGSCTTYVYSSPRDKGMFYDVIALSPGDTGPSCH